MTKAEERCALNLIRSIIANCGPDSYVSAAFDGCCELAEENIENDWLISFPERVKSLREKCRRAEARVKVLESENDDLRYRVERLEDTAAQLPRAKICLDEMTEAYGAATIELEESQSRADELQLEVLQLKARLYDILLGDEME